MIVGLLAAVLVAALAAPQVVAAPKTSSTDSTESTSSSNDSKGRLHAMLEKLASSTNSNWVEVILSASPDATVREVEMTSGGKVVRAWPFINAYHVTMPASKLRQLADNTKTKFVSHDGKASPTASPYDDDRMVNPAQKALRLQRFWDNKFYGQGIGVAVIDSGVAPVKDLEGRIVQIDIGKGVGDPYGHGTHVAGIIAGDAGDYRHVGVAPKATIYSLRVTDDHGNSKESDMLTALEWVYNNWQTYNIRVVNISMQSTVANNYETSPLAAAVEMLWMSGVTVVVSAGNEGTGENAALYPPANDPYVITVGAMDDNGTLDEKDDRVVGWSSQGRTTHGQLKPDIVTPGRGVLAAMAPNSVLAMQHASRIEDGNYIRFSGSSMASPQTAGVVALMLSSQPLLKPDQIKWMLMNYRRTIGGQITGGPLVPKLDQIYGEIGSPSKIPFANQGLTPAIFLSHDPALIADAQERMTAFFLNAFFLNINERSHYYDD